MECQSLFFLFTLYLPFPVFLSIFSFALIRVTFRPLGVLPFGAKTENYPILCGFIVASLALLWFPKHKVT